MTRYLDKLLMLLPVANIKVIAETKTNLPALLPLIGFISFLKDRKIFPLFLFLLLFPLYSLIKLSLSLDYLATARTFQLIGLILFSSFLTKKISRELIRGMLITIITSSLLIILYEFFMSELIVVHYAQALKRFLMMVGEPNFSAVLYLTFLGIALDFRLGWKFAVPLTIFVALTMSRMGFLGLLFAAILLIPKTRKIVAIPLILVTALYPILLKTTSTLVPDGTHKLLAKKETRYYIHNEYINLTLENPLGFGYFKAKEAYKKRLDLKADELKSKYSLTYFESNEQHNTSIQVLSDFGLLGYAFYVALLFALARYIFKTSHVSLGLTLYIFSSNFLNSLSEFSLWVTLAILASNLYRRDSSLDA